MNAEAARIWEFLSGKPGSAPPSAERIEELLRQMTTPGDTNQNPTDIGFLKLVLEDYATHDRELLAQGFWALFVHRFGNWRMGVRPRLARAPLSISYGVMHQIVLWLCGISLDYTVSVGRRVRIWHHGGMVLGARRIGNDVHIRQNTTFGLARRGDHWSKKPIIGDRVEIGAGAVIVGPIKIGDDAVVGANAVVLEDVPPGCMAVGVPARVIERKQKPAPGSNGSAPSG